ncbi:hypothetical protein DHW03_13975 [Pedobacter yonginense]|uniref:DUF262 domain-containing protein n=1 Tax=Pedobacter yonginense TaxID=651869 RepID=A0A317EPT1_9SPHI|nr:DUF262 domain-containing protein [Pedobacter yonginense]PWS27108.1 hypothetical protein DHW03_13975 [Pedobacter yonginense]
MIKFEANENGDVVVGEPFTAYDEVEELKGIFDNLKWSPNLIFRGRGGYYLFEISLNNSSIKLHIYLKKVSFGGRENRPYEKRTQFSAALDRAGYDAKDDPGSISLILGLYKQYELSEPIICAWKIEDWGNNIGRAFNCFTDIRSIAESYKSGFAQHKTSIGQISCAFKQNRFLEYINHRGILHTRIIEANELVELNNKPTYTDRLEEFDPIPKFDDLFQEVMDFLHNHQGIGNVTSMEESIAENLGLTYETRQKLHKDGPRTELGYRLAWARYYLKQAGLISSPKRTFWQLTATGESTKIVIKSEVRALKNLEEARSGVIKDSLLDYEEEDGIELEVESETQFIEHPFDPSLVDIRTKSMSLDLILKRLSSMAINMETSFQRKAGLWTITKQSRLIESILVKIPLPVFYFDGSSDDNWLVVDGLQRLTSLDNFVNKKSFALKNLEFLSQFNDKNFSQLPPHLQRRIEEFEITAYIIAPGTPKALKFNVFKRINTGGLTLTAQEIRNALNQGAPADFVKRLADMRAFKIATNFSISEDRMMDKEFVTRFLAFYLFPLSDYKSDMDTFLNSAMEKILELSNNGDELEKIASDFVKAMDASYAIFETDAFRKRYSIDDTKKPINKALFEVWAVCLSKLSDTQRNYLIANKNAVIKEFISSLNNDEEFNQSVSASTNDRSRVKKRFEVIDNIIKSNLESHDIKN